MDDAEVLRGVIRGLIRRNWELKTAIENICQHKDSFELIKDIHDAAKLIGRSENYYGQGSTVGKVDNIGMEMD